MKYVVMCILFAGSLFAQTDGAAKSSHLEPLKPAAFQLQLQFSQPVSPEDNVDIIFPTQFSLSQVVMASSPDLDGGIAVAVNRDTIKLQRVNADSTWQENTPFRVNVALIMNAPDMSETFQFKSSLRQDNQIVDEFSFESAITKLSNTKQE